MNRITLIVAGLLVWNAQAQNYPIVGTGQSKCYDNDNEIAPPKPGQPFFGQDTQSPGRGPAYQLSADGLTVYDKITGLTCNTAQDRTSGLPNTRKLYRRNSTPRSSADSVTGDYRRSRNFIR